MRASDVALLKCSTAQKRIKWCQNWSILAPQADAPFSAGLQVSESHVRMEAWKSAMRGCLAVIIRTSLPSSLRLPQLGAI